MNGKDILNDKYLLFRPASHRGALGLKTGQSVFGFMVGKVSLENFCLDSFIQQSVLRKVQSLFQNELSTECYLDLPPSNDSFLSCP